LVGKIFCSKWNANFRKHSPKSLLHADFEHANFDLACENLRSIWNASFRKHPQFCPVRTLQPSQISLNTFDYQTPSGHKAVQVDSQETQGNAPMLDVYEGTPAYAYRNQAQGQRYAQIRLQAFEARNKRFIGKSDCPDLASGHHTQLLDHHWFTETNDGENRLLILSVKHLGQNNLPLSVNLYADLKTAHLNKPGHHTASYRNEFECIRAKIPHRPLRTTPAPKITGLQTAVVTGPVGSEIHVNENGCIKVRFHWDRYNQFDDYSSCWIRVSQPWSGKAWGAIATPRVGQEVVIGFMDGDPDRPLVINSVMNAEHKTPFDLPSQKVLMGIRSDELGPKSRTVGSGSGKKWRSNHLLFDDTHGEIQAQLRSDHLHSQLSLGHITRIETHKGRQEARGQGFELRTDGHGALRAQKGLLISTEPRPAAQGHITSMPETTGRLNQAQGQHDQLGDAAIQAKAHAAGDQDEVAKALKVDHESIEGDVKSQARHNNPNLIKVHPSQRHFAEFEEPHLTLASPAGIQTSAQGNTHLSSQEHTALTSGGHTSVSVGKSLLISAKQAIKLFAFKTGMKLIAAANNIDLKALSGNINILAKLNVTHTANRITITAKEEVVINGGTSFTTWNEGGIEHGTKGIWVQQVGGTNLSGPKNVPAPTITTIDVALKETPPEYEVAFSVQPIPGPTPALFANQPYTLLKNGAEVAKGKLDAYGRLTVEKAEKGARYQVRMFNGTVHDMPFNPERLQANAQHPDHPEHQLSNKGYRADGLTAEQRLAQKERGTE
jgi:type VI secretion system secreted protein VgrG